MKNILLIIILILGQKCFAQNSAEKIIYLSNSGKKIEVNLETLKISLIDLGNSKYEISSSIDREGISNLITTATTASWKFEKNGISIKLELNSDFLDVNIYANAVTNFTFPTISSKIKAYTIPLHQGKFIPAQDKVWIEHMVSNEGFSGSQDLSMQFFASNYANLAIVYIIKNMFNNELTFFDNNGTLALKFNHQFPQTVKDKQYGFRIYFTQNNPVAIAKVYKRYMEETGKIITLEEKAKENPDIQKLFGAPHIYLWNTMFFVATDVINWKIFKEKIRSDLVSNTVNPTRHIFKLFNANEAESGNEFLRNLNEFKRNGNVNPYHRNILCRAFNKALLRKDFYNPAAWQNITLSPEALNLINKGLDSLNDAELYKLNRLLLTAAYPDIFAPMQDWGGVSISMLDEMYAAGIKKAWFGLNDWISGEIHPEFVQKAKRMGYLIGPYDDYHGMHEPGKEKWLTAKFDDTTLYSKAFIQNEKGKPVGGFLGVGRKLNPVLSLPAVKKRVDKIMKDSEKGFNTWFIDCDATGEIYDDYTPGRMTSQKDDMNARINRMEWIRDNYKLVTGSEVGNDFAAGTIAFAHGMTTPVIAWSDPDMRKNKDSKYYIGGYYSPNGGIPDKFILQVPLKDKYAYIHYDNRFNVPLFQLVYNNSVITSHHWEWSSLKVPDEIKNNELKEILYNVPPLYHLDELNWNKYKDVITKHVNVFSKIHETAVKLEMTYFEWLTSDHLVQRTKFGEDIEIIANFGKQTFNRKGKTIPDHSLLIIYLQSDKDEIYKP